MVPTEVVRNMVLAPAVPTGVSAVMDVAVATKLVVSYPLIVKLITLPKLVPVTVINVPPTSGPLDGLTVKIVGRVVLYVKAISLVAVPPGVVTATLFEPAVPAGVTADMEVELATIKLVASTPSTVTAVAPVKFVPVMVIVVPPPTEPDTGLTAKIVGAGITGS